MPVSLTGSRNAKKVHISIGSSRSILLDFSLQRHYYPNLDDSQAKPMNSIIYYSVAEDAIEEQLKDLGTFIEAKIKSLGAGGDLATANGDYNLGSSLMTWRVDNVSLDATRPPNHCYPISGANLWANVSQKEFAATAAIRSLEVAMTGIRDSVSKKWKSLQHLPPSERNANPIYTAISGARTHLRQGNIQSSAVSRIGIVSGRPDLLKEIAKIQNDA